VLDTKAKATKAKLLKHLTGAFLIPHFVRTITSEAMVEFYDMLAINLFRPIPPMPTYTVIEAHDSVCDLAWPHLSLAYEAFQSSFNCPQPTQLTPSFVYQLIGNGASPDERERAVVRGILHAMYAKFMALRPGIRERLGDHFSNRVCSAEIIEFVVSIVAGFNAPLANEHTNYFYRFVLPLHRLPTYPQFHAQLVELMLR
jgi:hypothetical protein